mgnify:CR=1 FL=1|jgi:hypothetical protein
MAIKQLSLAGFFWMFLINFLVESAIHHGWGDHNGRNLITFRPNVIGAESKIEQLVETIQYRPFPQIAQLENAVSMTELPIKTEWEPCLLHHFFLM